MHPCEQVVVNSNLVNITSEACAWAPGSWLSAIVAQAATSLSLSPGGEPAAAYSHLLGACLYLGGLVGAVAWWQHLAAQLQRGYVRTMITSAMLLLVASGLYHLEPTQYGTLQLFDHLAVFLLIYASIAGVMGPSASNNTRNLRRANAIYCLVCAGAKTLEMVTVSDTGIHVRVVPNGQVAVGIMLLYLVPTMVIAMLAILERWAEHPPRGVLAMWLLGGAFYIIGSLFSTFEADRGVIAHEIFHFGVVLGIVCHTIAVLLDRDSP